MTRDDIIRIAREAKIYLPYWAEEEDPKRDLPLAWTITSPTLPLLECFAALAAKAEREACADFLEHGVFDDDGHHKQYAKVIRARGDA